MHVALPPAAGVGVEEAGGGGGGGGGGLGVGEGAGVEGQGLQRFYKFYRLNNRQSSTIIHLTFRMQNEEHFFKKVC
jgi:hypothetical protein